MHVYEAARDKKVESFKLLIVDSQGRKFGKIKYMRKTLTTHRCMDDVV